MTPTNTISDYQILKSKLDLTRITPVALKKKLDLSAYDNEIQSMPSALGMKIGECPNIKTLYKDIDESPFLLDPSQLVKKVRP